MRIIHKQISTLPCVSVGDCPAVPCSSKSDPREDRLHPVRLPKTAAHVPHGVPRRDQQGPLPRSVLCSLQACEV